MPLEVRKDAPLHIVRPPANLADDGGARRSTARVRVDYCHSRRKALSAFGNVSCRPGDLLTRFARTQCGPFDAYPRRV